MVKEMSNISKGYNFVIKITLKFYILYTKLTIGQILCHDPELSKNHSDSAHKYSDVYKCWSSSLTIFT